jgi:hypothetical protein
VVLNALTIGLTVPITALADTGQFHASVATRRSNQSSRLIADGKKQGCSSNDSSKCEASVYRLRHPEAHILGLTQ